MTKKRQTAVIPKFYCSNLLLQHSSGGMDRVEYNGIFSNMTDLQMYDIISGDPSFTTQIQLDTSVTSGQIAWRLLPAKNSNESDIVKYWQNFHNSFIAILGHNLLDCGDNVTVTPFVAKDSDTGFDTPTYYNQLNNVVNGGLSSFEYNGWSLSESTEILDNTAFWFGLEFDASIWGSNPITIGSIFFGSSYTMPRNCDLAQDLQFDWKTKVKQTISGKTISSMQYDRPNDWVYPAFQLSESGDSINTYMDRTGLRSWGLSYSFLDMSDVIGANLMANDNLLDDDNTNWSNVESNYFTNVIQKTRGNHLPLMIQIDSQNNNPDNFALVRLGKRYKVKQISPDLYNIKIDLVEQV